MRANHTVAAYALFAALIAASLWTTSAVPVHIVQPADVPHGDSQNDYDEDNYDFPLRTPQPWDITANHPRRSPFSVSEGTWMSIDLHPTQDLLVFDLLGDLYTMPLSGGVATLLRGGVAHEIHPHFSIDGKSVLFTSDIDGCDNLWSIDLETKQARQVTFENFRFINSAQYSPDGRTIVAVKWITSSRSIPAGELWTYATSGNPNPGEKLVGRPTLSTQVGPEEPTYSPDGRYIYYSQNVLDSSTFNYDKDPQRGIYVIRRIELATGNIETIVSGTGGAARPVLSPDGKTLAFIRRSLFSTALLLRDIESGDEIILLKDLSHDQQASSAPGGVYPNFVWTRDGREIIFWANGKLWRVNIATGVKKEIPFQVNVDIPLAETVRPQIDPSTDSAFQIKVVPYADVHASGSDVVFTALSRTYAKSLPNGTPKPLTNQPEEVLEFSPRFSPSGRYIIQTSWTDTGYGRVEIYEFSNPTSPVVVTNTPGRYIDPFFSPDESKVVFTKLSSDSLSGPRYGLASGIYVATLVKQGNSIVGVSAPVRVTSGAYAQFSTDQNSLVISQYGSAAQYILSSGARSTLARSTYSPEVSLSPDLQYVAIVEFYEVYLIPYSRSWNGEYSSRPAIATPGTVRLTETGGEVIRFSDDGKTLRWLLAKDLFEVTVADVMRNCQSGSSDANDYNLECAKNYIRSVDLSFTVSTGLSDIPIVIDNATLITLDAQNTVIPNGRIVIQSGKITALGARNAVTIPAGAKLLDAAGGAVSPGYVDTHAHWSGNSRYTVKSSWEYLANLAFGVTTLHNPSSDTLATFADAEMVRSGRKTGPRLFSTGTILYGAGGDIRCEVNSIRDAQRAMKRLKAYGAWSVKSYQQPCRSSRQRILEVAKELSMAVVPEGGMNFQWNLNMLVDGHTTVEHNLPIAPLYEDVKQLFARSGTGYNPTLVVCYGDFRGENYWYQVDEVYSNERLTNFVPLNGLYARSVRRQAGKAPEDYYHFEVAASARALSDMGVPVGCGAHGQQQGIAYHWEMFMMYQGGMSPMQVLRTASADAARQLGLDKYIGSLEVGKLGDIVIYPPGKSPLDDIFNVQYLSHVMKDGRLYDAHSMDQVLPEFVPRPQGPQVNTPSIAEL
eukprot:TRINITY_DN627_c0_g1_i1.p1 TRINITY_DN627_c0_g1~~TRINITY_DN627_c0_g1_i1.p1  ORF type:complete len:1120 (-),score=222.97 TRINITY_DN627_c0_g1_i1:83-3442(-)